MGWDTIASLIVQYGLPFAEKVITKWVNKEPVTLDNWNGLKADAAQTAKDRMKAQLTAAGIALDDPKAVALLGMT